MVRWLTLLLFLCCFTPSRAQFNAWGVMPKINASIGLNETWKLNIGTETRFISEENTWSFARNQSNVAIVRKVGLRASFTTGYLANIYFDHYRNRLFQQLSIVRKWRSLRLGHRFALDENFGSQSAFQVRLGYRFLAEVPLIGEKVDIKEPYLKTGHTVVLAATQDDFSFENRILAMLGVNTNENNRFELGIDYRLREGKTGVLWVVPTWYYSF